MAIPTFSEAFRLGKVPATPIGQWSHAAAVTPSDSVDIGTIPTSAIFVGDAGTVTAVMAGDGAAVTFKCVAGQILPISVTRINTTNTSPGTSIVALW